MWDIFDEIDRMHRDMDRNFAMMFGGPAIEYKGKKLPAKKGMFRPAVADCYETENQVIACFELPGAEKEDIELNITDDYIEVKVEKKHEKETKEKGFHSYEIGTSQFYRRTPLPAGVDATRAKASYKSGVLKVEIPKTKQVEDKRKIKIE